MLEQVLQVFLAGCEVCFEPGFLGGEVGVDLDDLAAFTKQLLQVFGFVGDGALDLF